MQNLDLPRARNIVKLFKEDNTVPFICRYRKELIGEMTPDELRDVKISYNQILQVHTKAEVVMKNLDKDQKLTDDLKHDLLCAKTIDEIEHLYAPYKPEKKGSLADRAKSLGLEEYADDLLLGIKEVELPALVKSNVEGLETKHKVEDGIQHIMAFKFSKNTLVLEELRRL
jgi:transcriptional accessory protein Tex/SPT6